MKLLAYLLLAGVVALTLGSSFKKEQASPGPRVILDAVCPAPYKYFEVYTEYSYESADGTVFSHCSVCKVGAVINGTCSHCGKTSEVK